ALIRGFPNRRKDASLPVWARSNASRFLLKIGSGLRDWSRTATRRRRSYGGRGFCFWARWQWRGRGGTESGQERAHGAPLAATLCGQRGGRAVEGRHPPAWAQAADGEEN